MKGQYTFEKAFGFSNEIEWAMNGSDRISVVVFTIDQLWVYFEVARYYSP
jgi:hypothetical protein